MQYYTLSTFRVKQRSLLAVALVDDFYEFFLLLRGQFVYFFKLPVLILGNLFLGGYLRFWSNEEKVADAECYKRRCNDRDYNTEWELPFELFMRYLFVYREDKFFPVCFLELALTGFGFGGSAELNALMQELIFLTTYRAVSDVIQYGRMVLYRKLATEHRDNVILDIETFHIISFM
jgi:hypothetical protein